jgi:hypothetical protein
MRASWKCGQFVACVSIGGIEAPLSLLFETKHHVYLQKTSQGRSHSLLLIQTSMKQGWSGRNGQNQFANQEGELSYSPYNVCRRFIILERTMLALLKIWMISTGQSRGIQS